MIEYKLKKQKEPGIYRHNVKVSRLLCDHDQIAKCMLPQRLVNALQREKIVTVGQLRMKTYGQVMRMRGVGQKSLRDLKKLARDTYVEQLLRFYKGSVTTEECRSIARNIGINVPLLIDIYETYLEEGTLEKTACRFGKTRERVRQLLKDGAAYGLYEYPDRDTVLLNRVREVYPSRNDLVEVLSGRKTQEGMAVAIGVSPEKLKVILSAYQVTYKDITKMGKKRYWKNKYNVYVKKLGYHPSSSKMWNDKSARRIYANIVKLWGSIENFRGEFGFVPHINRKNKYTISIRTISEIMGAASSGNVRMKSEVGPLIKVV